MGESLGTWDILPGGAIIRAAARVACVPRKGEKFPLRDGNF